MTEKTKNNKAYKTHWHSFWFGFMSSLAIVLFVLLIATVIERVSFGTQNPKRISITKSENKNIEQESKPALSLAQSIETLDINKDEFNKCIEDGRHTDTVANNIASGKTAGVKGTPHSFVLIDDAIYEIPGAHTEKGMREFFDDLLAGNDLKAKDISDIVNLEQVTEDDWIRGNEKARITVIEYSDVDCPFCKKFHKATNSILSDYSDDVMWVFRHMPIDSLHPNARAKAEAAECVGEIGGAIKFWEYMDILFR